MQSVKMLFITSSFDFHIWYCYVRWCNVRPYTFPQYKLPALIIYGVFLTTFKVKNLLRNISPNLFPLIHLLETCIKFFLYTVVVHNCNWYRVYISTTPASYTSVWVWLPFLLTQCQSSLWSAYHLVIRRHKKGFSSNVVSPDWN